LRDFSFVSVSAKPHAATGSLKFQTEKTTPHIPSTAKAKTQRMVIIAHLSYGKIYIQAPEPQNVYQKQTNKSNITSHHHHQRLNVA